MYLHTRMSGEKDLSPYVVHVDWCLTLWFVFLFNFPRNIEFYNSPKQRYTMFKLADVKRKQEDELV